MVPTVERDAAPAAHLPQKRAFSHAERKIAELLALGDIRMDGERPWDIRVHNPHFSDRVLAHGSLGAGEAYMDGWWDVPALDEFVARLLRVDPYSKLKNLDTILLALRARLRNCQSRRDAVDVARAHYDIGNDLYQNMLGRSMQYTCAYWPHADTLDEAQTAKLHLICRKLGLEPGMRVLDLGCGFGGLAHFMASQYGCQVVAYNLSHEQVEYGRRWCAGLPVRIEERDYRDAAGEPELFHRVTAIGLCEHIGPRNYRGFFDLVYSRLRDGGLFLLHTIGGNASEITTDPWIDRYIFPNGVVPSIEQLGAAAQGKWVMEDWHNFGPDYDRTLMSWWTNFSRAWPRLRERYGERFYRMWRFYLLACAGTFRARKLQLWQVVFSKGDVPGYVPVR